MKRQFLINLAIPVFILSAAYIFIGQHYHLSFNGAVTELERKWEGEILIPQMNENRFAYLIDKKGNLYFAEASCQFDILSYCKDFKTYSSNLNLYDSPEEYKSYYSKLQNNHLDYYLVLSKYPSGDIPSDSIENISVPFPLAAHLKNEHMKEKANGLTLSITYGVPMSPDPSQFKSKD